ncbi:MAG: MOP flippase family protein [Cyanobacteria bacterium J069]|nr:MAG: polysaccharide biosynthesis protein [Cyanobacteria bacterium J069]
MASLKQLAIRGTAWVVLTYGISLSLRIGSNLILTRLLNPEMFGKVSLVWVFLGALVLFSDLGVAPSIIQSKRGDDPDFLNTAWTIQVIRGLILWAGSFLIAWPVSQFYGQPELIALLPFMGLFLLFDGFNPTKRITLNRHLSMRHISTLEISAQVISGIILIIWAWLSPTIWAIASAGVISAAISLMLNIWAIPGPLNKFAWDKTAVKEILNFGKWIFASSAMHFLSTQTDRLVLGKLLSLSLFGIYNLALGIAILPSTLIEKVGGSVIFPSLTKLIHLERHELRAKILKNRGLVLSAIAIALALLVSTGDIIISIMYDDRYSQAGWMLSILSLGIWPLALTNTIGPVLLALGQSQYSALGNFLSFLFLIIGIPLGAHFAGDFGAVVAVPLSNTLIYFANLYGLWRERLLCLNQDFRTTAIFLGILTLFLAGRVAAGVGLPSFNLAS